MSRTILWIVTGFLTLAMIAMVIVQAYWIKRSIDTEEQQLGLVVNQVLSEISDELVRNETLITILDEIRPPVVQSQSQAVWNFHIDARSAYNIPDTALIRIENEDLNVDMEDVLVDGEDLLMDPKEEVVPVLTVEPEEIVKISEWEEQGSEDRDVEKPEPEEAKHFTYTPPDHSLKNQKVKLISDSLMVVLGEDDQERDSPRSRSLYLSTFPLGLRGSSVTRVATLGRLYPGSFSLANESSSSSVAFSPGLRTTAA